ncbi:DUF4254 domain-containing protein [Candidatus Pacearchaeota archaeon]|nr:DUF4254 domain-containing protein [Candidatus Pacearchaeota archaeon]
METLGTLIDKLTVINVKCFHLIDIHGNIDLSDDKRLEAADKVRECNSQRNELIQEIDQFIQDVLDKKVKVVRKIVKEYKGGGSG